MTEYERALRECLLDCIALLEIASVRFEASGQLTSGQLRILIRDARNLYNREDVANYQYKKG